MKLANEYRVGGPGLAFETWVSPRKKVQPEHPGLKSETWATHSTSGECSFYFRRNDAKWSDCCFFPTRNHSNLGHPSPLVIPNEVRDLQCALRLSQILPGKRPG